MGDVVRLARYREPAVDKPLLYFCERCEGRAFTLHASGVTYCAECGALMRNLLVLRAPTELP